MAFVQVRADGPWYVEVAMGVDEFELQSMESWMSHRFGAEAG